MKNDPISPYSKHDEVMLLLPWFVNGTLKDRELEQVKDHLRVCLVCRKEVGSLVGFSRHMQNEATVEIPPDPRFDRLMARIRTESARPEKTKAPAKRQRFSDYISMWLNSLNPRYLGATLAGGLLILSLPMLYHAMPGEPVADYHTLSTANSMSRFTVDDIRVVFVDGTAEREIAVLLGTVKGRVVDGPSAAGVYTVRIEAADHGGGIREALDRLRKDKAVVLAEPALPPTVKPGRSGS